MIFDEIASISVETISVVRPQGLTTEISSRTAHNIRAYLPIILSNT
jgi:hypothetical protein